MKTMVKHSLGNVLDGTGLGVVLMSGYMHITELLKAFDYNKIVLALTSLVALIYLILKAQHQYLVNRNLKREGKKRRKKK